MSYITVFPNGVLQGIVNTKVTTAFNEVFQMDGRTITHNNGIDLVPIAWVIPIAMGKVIEIGFTAARGNYICLQHADGFESRYMHFANGTISVKKGDIIGRERFLGKVGATGNVTGAHLHLGILKNGVFLDPLPFLKGTQIILPYAEPKEVIIVMKRPEMPMLNILIPDLYYRDSPNGVKGKFLPKGLLPYTGKSEVIGGYEWAEVILDNRLVYCALNPAWNTVNLIQPATVTIEKIVEVEKPIDVTLTDGSITAHITRK